MKKLRQRGKSKIERPKGKNSQRDQTCLTAKEHAIVKIKTQKKKGKSSKA